MKDREDKLLNPRLIELEGRAMVGEIKQVSVEECDTPPGWKKIVAIDYKGERVETGCMEPDAARRNYMVLVLYVRRWSKLINWDAPK